MKTNILPKEKPEIRPPVTPVEPLPGPEIDPFPERQDQPVTVPEIPVPSPEPKPSPEKI